MDEDRILTVPYIAYESAIASNERRSNKLIAIIVILIVLLAASNIAWVIAWFQYDYVDYQSDDYSVDIDSGEGGNANYIGNDGNIYNGTSDGNTEKNESEK